MPIATRAIVIGLDAANPALTEFYLAQGRLPHLRKLMARGVYAPNAMAPWPTLTPPNWATIATGATAGTHGITCFTTQHAGDPLDVTYYGFNSEECAAEYLWEAAEAVGKRSCIVKWPTAWPPRGVQRGALVDGCHVHDCLHEIDTARLFSTERYPLATPAALEPATGWANLPPSACPPLAVALPLRAIRHREMAGRIQKDTHYPESPVLHVLVVADEGGHYDRAYVCPDQDAAHALCKLRPGELSGWLSLEFPGVPDHPGRTPGYFRLSLVELSADGRCFRLFCSHISPEHGYTFPQTLGPELTRAVGPFPIDTGYFGMIRSWVSPETALAMLDETHRWYAAAARYVWERGGWDLCMVQAHTIDLVLHPFLRRMDPVTASSPEEARTYQEIVGRAFDSLDAMIGELVALAGDDALVVVVSDHGSTTGQLHSPRVNDVLAEAGLLTYREASGLGPREIDWSRTRAAHRRTGYVYVNLKGRQPQGIVEPGAEYEAIREQILDLLLRYRDPATGKIVFTTVLRKEDAPILGLTGDRVGDLLFTEREDCDHTHGSKLTTAAHGLSNMRPLLLLAGPGIRQGVTLQRPIDLIDVAPTVAFALGIPTPRDTEGGVIYQAFENANYYPDAVEQLRQERDRWELAYTAHADITHQE